MYLPGQVQAAAPALGLLRRRPDCDGPYTVGVPWLVPVVFVVAAFGIAANQIVSQPAESAVGLSFVIAGLPVYYLWNRPTTKHKDDAP